MMHHFVWSKPHYFNNCTEEESCQPLNQCKGDNIGVAGFPYMCGWDKVSKNYKYCCKGMFYRFRSELRHKSDMCRAETLSKYSLEIDI